jgi:hypothetical protein
LKVCFLLTTLAIVIWAITTVGLTLVCESGSDVYTVKSTGQLIPFIIGICLCNFSQRDVHPWSNIAISVNARNMVVIRDSNDADNELASPGEASVNNVPSVRDG